MKTPTSTHIPQACTLLILDYKINNLCKIKYVVRIAKTVLVRKYMTVCLAFLITGWYHPDPHSAKKFLQQIV